MKQHNRCLFWFVGLLHCIGGALLPFAPIDKVTWIANTHATWMPLWASGLLLFSVGLLAIMSTRVRTLKWAMGLIVWQQLVLMASAYAAVISAVNGRYPDGTPAGHWHIAADQLVYVLMSMFHLLAVIETHGGDAWSE